MSAARPEMKRKFAVFDIDGTLIRWQLYHAIVEELITQKLISEEACQKIEAARNTWRNRSATFHEYERTLLDVFRMSRTSIKFTDFETAIENVFAMHKDQVYTYTRNLVKQLKTEGFLLFAISGSHQEIIAKLGDYYGFDEVIGARVERMADGTLGQTVFSPARDGKADVLKQLCAKHGVSFEGSYAVGDSKSDAAMLELVAHPIAFNPDKELFQIAHERGWRVVVERKNMIYELKADNGTYLLAPTN